MCLIKILKAIGIVILILLLLFAGFMYYGTSMKTLPKGDFVDEFPSPLGIYTVQIYEHSSMTTPHTIRGVFVDNLTHKRKNIYWARIRSREVSVQWLDEENVIIDGIELNVLRDIYDYRKQSQ